MTPLSMRYVIGSGDFGLGGGDTAPRRGRRSARSTVVSLRHWRRQYYRRILFAVPNLIPASEMGVTTVKNV
jgi:hypothetical protein